MGFLIYAFEFFVCIHFLLLRTFNFIYLYFLAGLKYQQVTAQTIYSNTNLALGQNWEEDESKLECFPYPFCMDIELEA